MPHLKFQFRAIVIPIPIRTKPVIAMIKNCFKYFQSGFCQKSKLNNFFVRIISFIEKYSTIMHAASRRAKPEYIEKFTIYIQRSFTRTGL